jgi:hypothetical protein
VLVLVSELFHSFPYLVFESLSLSLSLSLSFDACFELTHNVGTLDESNGGDWGRISYRVSLL